MSPVEIIAALLVPLFWGVQFVTTKVGVAAIPPLLFGALRFAAVAVLLLPFAGKPAFREVGASACTSPACISAPPACRQSWPSS